MGAFDVDFTASADRWLKAALPSFGGETIRSGAHADNAVSHSNSKAYSKNKPYQAEILEKLNLHGKGSGRQTLHIELNADLPYEPGDSAGIVPVNASALVNEVITVTGLNSNDEVEINGVKRSLFDALKLEVELSKITVDVIKRLIEFSPNKKLTEIAHSARKSQKYLYGRDVVDLFTDFPLKLQAQQLVMLLRPIQPRLYSISSSPRATPGELHLTVSVVEYENEGRIVGELVPATSVFWIRKKRKSPSLFRKILISGYR